MQKPLVSIVITSFNRLAELKENIKRTEDIKYPSLEIIIVDGDSTDGSVEYLRALDSRAYKAIILEVDKGTAYTTTQGMKAAAGEFIIIIDDDCFLRPSVVEKTVEIFQANPNLAVIGYGLVNPNVIFNEDDYRKETEFTVKSGQFNDSYQTLIYGSGSAFRKSALEKVGYYDLSWDWSTGSEDVELNFNLIAYGYNAVLIPELVAFHKISPKTRDSDSYTINCIHGTIWIILKYYPFGIMLSKLFTIFDLCVYFSILYRKTLYLKAMLRSAGKAFDMFRYKKKLKYSIAKKVNLPTYLLFSHNREVESSSA